MCSREPLTLAWPLKTLLTHLFHRGALETPIQLWDGVEKGFSSQGHGGKMWQLKEKEE